MNPPVILACGARKASGPRAALDLYTGPYFLATRRWAESVTERGRIFIVSALYGFLAADQVVEPYDVRLDAGRVAALVDQVRHQAAMLLEPCTLAYLPWYCGGAEYSELLTLANVPHHPVTRQMPPGRVNRGIGGQRRWYADHHGRLPRLPELAGAA